MVHRAIENEQFFDVLRTAFAAGEEPDIFQHETHNQLWQFVRSGQVADITDWYTANQARFAPGTEEAIMWEGKYYGVPQYPHTVSQIFYNADLLAANGIDPAALETWDDYLAAFQTLKDAGVTPIAFANKFGWPGSQWFYALLARSAGAEKVLQLAAGNCGYQWTDPDVVRAAELYTELATSEYFSAGMASDDNPQAQALFFSGQAAFIHQGSWFIGEAKEMMPAGFNMGMNTFPTLSDSAVPQDNIVAGVLGGTSISAKGAETPAKREAAMTFLDYLTTVPTVQAITAATGDISAIVGGNSPEVTDPFIQRIIAEELEVSGGNIPFLEHILPPAVGEDALWNGGVGVLTGELTPQTWMEQVQAAADANEPVVSLPETCQ